MTYVDAHCHLADPKLAESWPKLLEHAAKLGITTFVQGGVDPADWQRQIKIKAQAKVQGMDVVTCFGVHPYTVADHEDCHELLDELAKQLNKGDSAPQAVGEMGLDFRPHIAKASEDRQIEVFAAQLELAAFAKKAIVLHIVQAHEEALRVLDFYMAADQQGIVHSFNGSVQQAKDFVSRGLCISVGGPLCRADNHRLHQAVQAIAIENICLETDSPDQPPPSLKGQLNQPASLIEVAAQLAKLKSLPVDEVLDRTSRTARKLFHI